MENVILILRPQPYWNIVGVELKRVDAIGRYLSAERTVRPEDVRHTSGADADEQLLRLSTLCYELRSESLYGRYANKKVYRREADFWNTTDDTVRQHTKRMADRRVVEAVRLATVLDIPILYAQDSFTQLCMEQRLRFREDIMVTPLMLFKRHANGITYRLQLRLGEQHVVKPSDHRTVVLCHQPGLFMFDGDLLLMQEGFCAKLLLPFVAKEAVEIPQRMENDYFRRFILRNVAKAEVQAEGFDISDTGEQPQARLALGTTVDGQHLLQLSFRYGEQEYYPYSTSTGRVTLREDGGGFRFIRQLRDVTLEQHYSKLLHEACCLLKSNGSILFASLAEMIAWLQCHGEQLRQQGFSVVQPSEKPYYIGLLDVQQSDEWHGDWLQTDVTIVLDEGRLRIPFLDLRDTILRGEQDYMLPSGQRLLIPQEWLQRYSDLLLLGRPKGKSLLRHRSQMTALYSDMAERSADTARLQLQNPKLVIPQRLRATLRPYQRVGYEWLWHNFEAATGCCLSDEMGLGKTIQTIALLLKYKEEAKPPLQPKPSPGMLFTEEEMSGEGNSSDCKSSNSKFAVPFLTSLVVAPASVVHNWMNELKRFAPSLLVCNYTGDTALRRQKRRTLMRWDVVVTTYGTLRKDIDELQPCQFGIVAFDESQAFKTPTSTTHHAVARINALYRLALSGTPVENNVGELWSLMSVLNPDLLGSRRSFQRSFAYPITRQLEVERTGLLRRLVAPYFLKRTKEEVLSDLPERQDEVVVCPMTDAQTRHYAEELSRARNEWIDNSDSAAEVRRSMYMLAALQRLRRIANGEGKMNVVFERLEQLRDTRHKVLIFSEYVSTLERVGNEMQHRGWQYDMLTGHTQQREQVIAHFQHTPQCQFFLISLKAGGLGLNLTAADYVLLLDPWWNLAAEEQAIARAHRIGQHRPVFVYRFVSENTLEQQILTIQERKQTLIDSVMPFMGLPQA